MDGEVENVFIMKSYLSMEGVKLDVQIGSRERETLKSLEESGAILNHLLLRVTG